MKNKSKSGETGRGDSYRYIVRKRFTSGGTRLIVADCINTAHPRSSERVLWIDGTDAYYSIVPLDPEDNSLLCFTFCEDALSEYEPDFCRHALVLGCGGGAIPRWLLGNYPSVTVDVVDRSEEIIDVCSEYFLGNWKKCDRLKFHCVDAKDYEPPEYEYQFIFCDIFDGTNLAPMVYSYGFASKLRSMISDDGCLIVNCGWDHLDEIKPVYQNEFEYLEVIEREPWQTEVIKASGRPFKQSR